MLCEARPLAMTYRNCCCSTSPGRACISACKTAKTQKASCEAVDVGGVPKGVHHVVDQPVELRRANPALTPRLLLAKVDFRPIGAGTRWRFNGEPESSCVLRTFCVISEDLMERSREERAGQLPRVDAS